MERKGREKPTGKRVYGKKRGRAKKYFLVFKRKLGAAMSKKWVKITVAVVACTLGALLLARIILGFLPVRKYEVLGDTMYYSNEIIDAAGIRSGSSLYGINKKKAVAKLVEGCPYIKKAEIKIKFPDTVCFVVEEQKGGWYMQVGEDFYALDYDLNVLLETYDEEMLKDRKLTKLVLPELESVVCGKHPKFGRGDEQLISETLTVVDTVRTHRIKERLTCLDLSNRFEIKMSVDGTYDVNFGDMTDASTKFSMIEEIIKSSKKKGYAGGEINVINPLAHSFRGYFAPIEDSTDTEKSEKSRND